MPSYGYHNDERRRRQYDREGGRGGGGRGGGGRGGGYPGQTPRPARGDERRGPRREGVREQPFRRREEREGEQGPRRGGFREAAQAPRRGGFREGEQGPWRGGYGGAGRGNRNSNSPDEFNNPNGHAYRKHAKVCKTSILGEDMDIDELNRLATLEISQIKVFVLGHDYVKNFFEHAARAAVTEQKSLEQWLMVDQLVSSVHYHGVAQAQAYNADLVPIERLRAQRPEIIILDIGTNDVDSSTDPTLIVKDVLTLAKKIRAEARPLVVVMCSIVENRTQLKNTTRAYYQTKARLVNKQLNAACFTLTGIEFFRHKVNCNKKLDHFNADGIHPDIIQGLDLYKRTMKQAMLGARTELRCAQIVAKQEINAAYHNGRPTQPPLENIPSFINPPGPVLGDCPAAAINHSPHQMAFHMSSMSPDVGSSSGGGGSMFSSSLVQEYSNFINTIDGSSSSTHDRDSVNSHNGDFGNGGFNDHCNKTALIADFPPFGQNGHSQPFNVNGYVNPMNQGIPGPPLLHNNAGHNTPTNGHRNSFQSRY